MLSNVSSFDPSAASLSLNDLETLIVVMSDIVVREVYPLAQVY
jgi:hypothetical protein